jgi:cytochrome P450
MTKYDETWLTALPNRLTMLPLRDRNRMVTDSATVIATTTKPAPPGPLDDAGYRFLPPRLRSRLMVMPPALRNPPEYFVKMSRQYGGIVTLSPRRIFLVAGPDCVKHVLQDHHTNYIKGPAYNLLKPLMGNGLFSSDGEDWRRQRHRVQPAFQREHNPRMAEIIGDATGRMLERWEGIASRGQAINVRSEIMLLTLEVLLWRMFSGDLIGHEQELRDAFFDCSQHMDLLSALGPVRVAAWFRIAGRLRFQRAIRVLESFIFRVVEQRRRNHTDNGDLVSLLLWARDEQTGELMSDVQIRDELMTMLQAGNDTVSDAITWTWYLMAKHPEVRQRVEQEVDSTLGGRLPQLEDMPALDYTTRVIFESLRIYPPGWAFGRSPVEDDVVGGYHVPAKSMVVISPYATHRLPDIWPNPETFDPDRFLPERSRGRPRFAYFPFSAGPRQCIGASLATLEAQMIISMAAQRYRLTVPPGFSAGLRPRISLTSNRTIWLTPISRRSLSADVAKDNYA